ncbi:signaling lymphocytic activation molecule-like [Gymnogyps californianus]|uniref:signaling lymphocytic activation molecule-like n=1 Tax=Gymnogyps californianus TaxID=33616 RepID=UPI0021CA5E25|nr:signaling lymphocytic activation molecule-like [Gymnogyps californianus]
MGCNVCLWLLISLGRVWGTGRGTRETVLGTLGKATILRIPLHLQKLTLNFGAAVWKRDTDDPHRKLVLLKYLDGNYTNYMQRQTRFHKSDFSLEILNTSRQDRQLYEYIASTGSEETVWQIQLEVYEPVSDPSIQILGWALANGSCNVTLNCTAERGDNVSYSWGRQDTNTSGLCSRNGSLLHLSYILQNTSITCACTASNPISRRVVTFNSSECSYEQGGSAGLRTEHLVLMVVVPVAAVMLLTGAFVATRSAMLIAGQRRDRSPLTEDSAVHTIYSQVQRVEVSHDQHVGFWPLGVNTAPRLVKERVKLPCSVQTGEEMVGPGGVEGGKGPRGELPAAAHPSLSMQKQKGAPAAEHPSCTTIYAAATGLPPDTAPAPGRALRPPCSPLAEPPIPQGHPSLLQSPDKEPTTVYASVMMPVA